MIKGVKTELSGKVRIRMMEFAKFYGLDKKGRDLLELLLVQAYNDGELEAYRESINIVSNKKDKVL